MRELRRFLVVVSLVAITVTGSGFAATRGDDDPMRQVDRGSKIRQLIHRVLDYLDSKITIPPT